MASIIPSLIAIKEAVKVFLGSRVLARAIAMIGSAVYSVSHLPPQHDVGFCRPLQRWMTP